MSTKRTWVRTGLATMAAATLLLVSACNSGSSSSTGTDDEATTASGGGAGGVDIYVVGGKSDDPFWSRVKRGAEDAAKVAESTGGSVTWLGPQNYDNLGPDAAKLIDTAVSNGADVVVGPDWVPEAEDAAFKRVVDKGIPLFIYNSGGLEAADSVGALNYIGSDDHEAGVAGGEYLGEQGVQHVLCVNTLPGAANSEARCAGLAEGVEGSGGEAEQLPMPSSSFGNPTAVSQGIKAALLKDDTVDAVVTIGTGDADAAASAIEQAELGDRVSLGTFDLDETQLSRIKDGTQLFAIDQQPYMQGYLAVSMANSYVLYGIELPQRPLLTGPAIIDGSNVESAIAGAEAGVR
ncbi:sugar ABC transporter substrate-binding protein [Promicromonospora soli]|uniref:Sugar ABC transporter substrate-binding protein n=1 Tax=Promicromonospora soli TaxID=2035533 RepID=A0A919L174_9MICO|nr:sugar ABC transporter substrate-binding protein [Promicromonospora soli]GHH80128.1 sugar ABC transporter substrate-binding protein [Promicromonospora soli]